LPRSSTCVRLADATSLTEAGYVARTLRTSCCGLIQAADFDISRAERGIIYIDEIDNDREKVGYRPSPGTSAGRVSSRRC